MLTSVKPFWTFHLKKKKKRILKPSNIVYTRKVMITVFILKNSGTIIIRLMIMSNHFNKTHITQSAWVEIVKVTSKIGAIIWLKSFLVRVKRDEEQWTNMIYIPREFFKNIYVLKYFVNLIYVQLLSEFGNISMYL